MALHRRTCDVPTLRLPATVNDARAVIEGGGEASNNDPTPQRRTRAALGCALAQDRDRTPQEPLHRHDDRAPDPLAAEVPTCTLGRNEINPLATPEPVELAALLLLQHFQECPR